MNTDDFLKILNIIVGEEFVKTNSDGSLYVTPFSYNILNEGVNNFGLRYFNYSILFKNEVMGGVFRSDSIESINRILELLNYTYTIGVRDSVVKLDLTKTIQPFNFNL